MVSGFLGETMTTSDNKRENESTKENQEPKNDRLEEIKKEEQEDASSYYAQEKEEAPDTKAEFEKPVPPVGKAEEDMSLLRTVAFLGFGLAALAIVFILFFIRDLDERVGGVGSAVNKLEGTIGPLKTEVEGSIKSVEGSIKAVEESLQSVSQTVTGLQGKLGDYEKTMAIMELKRALVMVQGISNGSNSGVKSKSSEVAASIQTLLNELGGGNASSGQPAGEIQVKEASEEPAAPAAEAKEAPAEDAVEPATEEPEAEEAPESEESAGEAEEPAAEETEEEPEAAPVKAAVTEESHDEAAASGSDGHAGEEHAGAGGMEELPTVEELLKESN